MNSNFKRAKNEISDYLKKYYGSTLENSYQKQFQKKKPSMKKMMLKKKTPIDSKIALQTTVQSSFQESERNLENLRHSKNEPNNTSVKSERVMTSKTFGSSKFDPQKMPKNIVSQKSTQKMDFNAKSSQHGDSLFDSIHKKNSFSQSKRSETLRVQIQEFQDLLNNGTNIEVVTQNEQECKTGLEDLNKSLIEDMQSSFNIRLRKITKFVECEERKEPLPIKFAKESFEANKFDQLMIKSSNEELFALIKSGREEKVSFSFGKNTSYQEALSSYNSVKNSDFYKSNCSSNFNAFEKFLKPISTSKNNNYESLANSVKLKGDPIAEINKKFDKIQGQTEALKSLIQNRPKPNNNFQFKKTQNEDKHFGFESKASDSIDSYLSKEKNQQLFDANQSSKFIPRNDHKGHFIKKNLIENLISEDSDKATFNSLENLKEEVKYSSEARKSLIVQQIVEFEAKNRVNSNKSKPEKVVDHAPDFPVEFNENKLILAIEVFSEKDFPDSIEKTEPKIVKNAFYLNENNKFSFKDSLFDVPIPGFNPAPRKTSTNKVKPPQKDALPEVDFYISENPRPLDLAFKPESIRLQSSIEETKNFCGTLNKSENLNQNKQKIKPENIKKSGLTFDENLDRLIGKMLDRKAIIIQRAWREIINRTTSQVSVNFNSLFNKFLEFKNQEKINNHVTRNFVGSSQTNSYSLKTINENFGEYLKKENRISDDHQMKIKEIATFVKSVTCGLEVLDQA